MLDSGRDQIHKKLYEDYEDSLFKLILFEAAEKEGKLFLKENEQLKNDPAFLPSAEEENRFKKLLNHHIHKVRNHPKRKMICNFANKVAVAVLAVVFVFTGAILTVQAFRTDVLNFLISIEPKYTSIQLNESENETKDENLTVNWKNAYVPTYIPAGFEADNLYYSDSLKTITFHQKNSEKKFIAYSEYDASNDVELDTENASLIKLVQIQGHKGTLVIKNSITTVSWEMDKHIFTINGNVDGDEIVKMAENVNFIK
ncbi:DUF4367 domain-containing protein [Caproiciproducens galactitolivorans]|uniref:DUF4367 domain-containing protein n=1 Tax=Caproiciproducens galactitolivorans TaxID=642589 RepID=A0ABT4BRK6_9FIRM|nr:DUF4367 domain-containing protein [Caproiciproducens galactitolivorans]MCY1713526.1 DUF4367 domain-containing protein [Caproiciproducens galactitolivorans]